MRRPRAFTCSRIRAEPLPPPVRDNISLRTLEEDYATVTRRSSTCNCGSCSSSPHARLPESATISSRHSKGYRSGVNPLCEDAIVSPHDYSVHERSRPAISRLASGRAPARRALFNAHPISNQPSNLSGAKIIPSRDPNRGSPASPGVSERKRGKETVDSTVTECAETLCMSIRYSGDGFDSPCQSSLEAAALVSHPGFGPASATWKYHEGTRTRGGAETARVEALKESVSACPGNATSRAASALSDSSQPVPTPCSDGSTGPARKASAGFAEWQAPETAGTFSLGTPSHATACSRRRRILRMRVGG